MLGSSFEAVLAAAAAGDEQAFARLWRDLQPAVLRYLRVVVGDSAEDVASETWLEVVRDFGRFHGNEDGWRAWVFTIARHRALDARKWHARQRSVPVAREALLCWEAPDDPEGEAAEALGTRRALAVIAQLPHDQAEVVALRLIAGLEVDRVAAVIGKRPGTVRVLSHRGLRRLAERLRAGSRSRGGVTP
jgi:RNA polymerase sigma-70 factor (ECF subfamily)